MFNIVIKCKSDKDSDEFKHDGNVYYKRNEKFNALICYNKSICFAESKQKLALAYGNRSAVFYELKKYKESLLSIQWAKECEYPKDKVKKLNEREKKCKQFLASQVKVPADDPNDFFKLSYPANPKIPFIADCIEYKNKNDCHGLYAKHDLKAGDIIAWEEMSFKRIFCPGQYNRCCYCLKSDMMNLIPCEKTASMMFCSLECRNKTYQLYGDEIDFMIITASMELNSDRILIDIEDIFGGREKLLKFLNENDVQCLETTIFDFDWNDKENRKKFEIMSLLSLPRSKILFLSFTPPSFKIVRGNEKYFKLLGLISQVINLNLCNVTYDHYQMSQQTCPELVHDGFTISLFSPYLSLSCMNNIDRVIVDNKIFYYIVKPVEKGEKLTANKFALEYHKTNSMQRQSKYLMNHLACVCYACSTHLTPNDFKCLDPRVLNEAIEHSEMAWKKVAKTKAQLKENWKIITARCKDMLSVEVPVLKAQNIRMIRDLAYSATFPC